jgi:hypothetical protein
MVVTKEKIKTLVDTMPINEAERLLLYITENFQLISNSYLWDAVKEVEPDEIDKQMLNDMKKDPDCYDFT